MGRLRRHSSKCDRTGHYYLWCHEYSTLRRCEARHHTEIVSGVGDSDRHTVGLLFKLQPYLDATRGRPLEAEAEGQLPLGPVGGNIPPGDRRATDSCTPGIDP